MADPDQRAARRKEVTTARRATAAPVVPQTAQPPNWLAQLGQMLQQNQQQPQMPVQQMAPMPVYTPPPMAAPDLSPEEIAYFDTLGTRLNSTYEDQMAQNLFQQGNLNLDQNITMRDLEARFDRQREQLPGGYQRRGLMNSGIYQQGLSDYATQRTNATTDQNLRYQRGLSGLQNQAASYTKQHSLGTAENAAMRQARRAGKAAALRAVL